MNIVTNDVVSLMNHFKYVIMPKEVTVTKFLRSRHGWKKSRIFSNWKRFCGKQQCASEKKAEKKAKKSIKKVW